jgi:hypothetical protein
MTRVSCPTAVPIAVAATTQGGTVTLNADGASLTIQQPLHGVDTFTLHGDNWINFQTILAK